MKNNRRRAFGTSVFCYNGPLTPLSFEPNARRICCLRVMKKELRSKHRKKTSHDPILECPKGGVETFDQMYSDVLVLSYAQQSKYLLLIIYCHNVLSSGSKPLLQRGYMKQLHEKLVEPWLKRRLEMSTMLRKKK